MAKKPHLEQLNYRVPPELKLRFQELGARFGVIERTLTAAVEMFLAADRRTQRKWYDRVSDTYWLPDEGSAPSAAGDPEPDGDPPAAGADGPTRPVGRAMDDVLHRRHSPGGRSAS